jgi:hypothetical protein
MRPDSETEIPKIRLASEPWVMEQIMNTEQRIERAFHDQTKYLSQKHDTLTADMHRSHLQSSSPSSPSVWRLSSQFSSNDRLTDCHAIPVANEY